MSDSKSLFYRSADGSERLFYPGLADGSNPSKAQAAIPLLCIFILVFVVNVATFKRSNRRARREAEDTQTWMHDLARQPKMRAWAAMLGFVVLALCFGMSIVNSWTRVINDAGTRMDFGVLSVRIKTHVRPDVSINGVYTFVCEDGDRIQYASHKTQCHGVRMGGILVLIYEIVAALGAAASVCLGLRGFALKGDFPRQLAASTQVAALGLMCSLMSWSFSGHFMQQETFSADTVRLSSSWIMCLIAWAVNVFCINFWSAYVDLLDPPPVEPAVVAVQVRAVAPIVEVPVQPASSYASSGVELASASPPGGPPCDAAPMPEPPRDVVLHLGGMAPPPGTSDAEGSPPPYEEAAEVRL